MNKLSILFLLFLTTTITFASPPKSTDAYVATLKKVTDIMVYDVTSPVASARYYGYVTLATYEVLSKITPAQHKSIVISLKRDIAQVEPIDAKDIDIEQATLLAILKTAIRLLPSGIKLKSTADSLLVQYRSIDKTKTDRTEKLVDGVVNQIVGLAMNDGFRQLNNLRRYTPKKEEEFWKPTAPAFMAPVEPHWRTVKTFLLDSAQQFKTLPPTAYSLTPNSSFYKQVRQVMEVVNAKKKKQQQIAEFWDCNPYAISQIGHVEFGTKKISPGGHWIGIAGIACKKANLPLSKTIVVHTILSMTMHDAFVACWDEKYRSNRVRPETVINQHFDPLWRPLLQTPPFPEYVSGHSVVSSASAIILTHFLGDNFAFADDSEVEFGLPIRKFKSFKQAADEACISRLYGGIHYIDAIEQGKWQGTMVANHCLKTLAPFLPNKN